MAIEWDLNKKTKRVVVIGGGIGGVYTAWKLSKSGYAVKVLEKQNIPGGFASSIPYKDCKIDIGPHFVSLKKNSEITKEIKEILGDELIRMPDIHKWYKSYFEGKILDQNPTILDLVLHSGPSSFFKSIFSIMFKPKREIKTVQDYLISSHGKFIYEKWCKPYLLQNYGHLDLPLDYVKSRFGPITIHRLIHRLKKSKNNTKPTKQESTFFDCYFRHGMGVLVERLCEGIRKNHGEILLNTSVQSIKRGQQKTIVVDNKEEINSDIIVYATPLQVASKLLDLKLKERSVGNFNGIMVFLIIDTDQLFDGWILNVFDSKIPFFRIAQQSYLSKEVCPLKKTLVSVEIRDVDETFEKYQDQEIIDIVKTSLKRMDLIENEKISGHKIIRFKNLYPKSRPNKNSNINPLPEIKFTNEFYLGTFEMDTGRLVSETRLQEKESPAAGGIYLALNNSNNLVKKILESDMSLANSMSTK